VEIRNSEVEAHWPVSSLQHHLERDYPAFFQKFSNIEEFRCDSKSKSQLQRSLTSTTTQLKRCRGEISISLSEIWFIQQQLLDVSSFRLRLFQFHFFNFNFISLNDEMDYLDIPMYAHRKRGGYWASVYEMQGWICRGTQGNSCESSAGHLHWLSQCQVSGGSMNMIFWESKHTALCCVGWFQWSEMQWRFSIIKIDVSDCWEH